MGGGGGGGGGDSTSNSEPWEGQQPYLLGQVGRTYWTGEYDSDGNPIISKTQDIAGLFPEANALYQSGGFAGDYYPNSTVSDESGYTTTARDLIANRALNGSLTSNVATNAVLGQLNSGSSINGNEGYQNLLNMSNNAGYTALTNGSNTGLNNLTNGSNQGYNALLNYTQANNPYMAQVYQNAAEQKNAAINSNFESAGRLGSGAHAASIADTDSDLAATMYDNAYNTAATAANNAANAYTTMNTNAANAYNDAATAAGNIYNTAQSNAANAYNTATANDNTRMANALGAANTLDTTNSSAYDALASAGSSLDDYNQSVVDADVDRWNYNQSQDAQNLQGYANMIGGSYGGTTVTTTDSGGK